ncbi:flavodoxin domain-containing protein [Zavarzinia sp. CC-PAN008]|uniref:flavodoxin domain-containing protein n=1 Tax=Zavarzinia sp. CC-PAN008 TaxID=3243332 RepID=UPI003F747EC6
MTRPLTILVGTMTGTAELVARDVADALQDLGHAPTVLAMEAVGVEALAGASPLLVCTSTYGQGDVPDNARALVESLEATRPDLSGLRFAVIALGDRTYAETYCAGGLRFDALLRDLGATRLGEVLILDASSGEMPEDVAVAWIRDWHAAHAIDA